MALERCKEEIGKVLGRELTKREEGIVARRASSLKDKIDRAGNDPTAVNGIIAQFGEEAEAESNRARRQAALNYLAQEKLKGWASGALPKVKDGGELLLASVRGSLLDFEGAKDSVASLAQHEMNRRATGLMAKLWKAGVQDYAFRPENNVAIGSALYDLRRGSPEADLVSKYGKLAAQTATILEGEREGLRLDLNKAGAWIGKNSDAIFRRSHDSVKIAKAGGFDYGSEQAKAYWVDSVHKKMDWRDAFDGELAKSTDTERKALLGDLHTQFASGVHLQEGGSGGYGIGKGNKGNKWSHARQLVFKSAKDEVSYLEEFGKGHSISEIVHDELRSGGKDLALMSKFGPNAEANFDALHDHLAFELKAKGKVKELARLDKMYKSLKDNDWRLLNGLAGHPADNYAGRWLTAGRFWTSAAALMNSIWSLTGDTAIRASMIAQRSGGSVTGEMLSNYLKQAVGTGLSKTEQIALAAEMGIRFEGITAPLDPYLSDHVPDGAASKFMRFTTRFGGHNGWVNRERVNSLTADSNHYWSLRGSAMKDLKPSEASMLRRFGIDESGWDAIRKAKAHDLGNGQMALTPDSIHGLDPKAFTGTEAQQIRARTELANKYRNLLGELADRSTVSPSLALQATMGLGRAGLQRGTFAGEAYRGALQLKGFVVNYMQNHLGRELYGLHSEYVSFPKAMADMISLRNPAGRSAAKGISKLMVAGYLNFLAVNSLKDMAMGKTTLDPSDWNVQKHGSLWNTPGFTASLRAFAKQSLGLYGEVLAGDANKPDQGWAEKITSKAIGPEAEFVTDLADVFTKYAKAMGKNGGASEKDKDAASQRLFGTLWRQAPGTQMFWTKGASDYFLYNELSEALNPGYKQRLRDRMKKQGTGSLFGNP